MGHLHMSLHSPNLVFCHAIGTIFTLQIIHLANSLSFDYPNFKNGDVNCEGDASPYKGAIQVTSNSIGQNINYSFGRVTSFEQMQLWSKNSGKLSDFTTKFSFVIYSEQNQYGDGMVFFLADPELPLVKDLKEGGGLGLVDGNQVLKSTKHSFVAVEFDTFNNPSWDPSGEDTHVGLDFNSMRSNITKPWLTDIQQWRVYNCSIEYSSTTFDFSVTFTMYTDDDDYDDDDVEDKPYEENISYKIDLRDLLPERVIFGFSAATGKLYEVHTLQSWSFSSSLPSEDINDELTAPFPSPISENVSSIAKGKRSFLLAGLGVGIGLAISLSGLVCALLWK